MSTNRLRLSLVMAILTAILSACAPDFAASSPIAPRATPTPHVVVGLNTDKPVPLPTLTPTSVLFASPTPLVDLGAGQHITANGSYSAIETEAAGPMVCHIQRDSDAFSQFIGVFDSRLLWSGGEAPPYGDEDHRMHPAMLRPLSTLVDLVETEWNGEIKIMVTEAYDSLLDHDLAQADSQKKYSLHFEGRSIDMIPWPPSDSPTILSRMCALAHTAGFDWVHNEQNHCHASVKAQSLCDLYNPTAP